MRLKGFFRRILLPITIAATSISFSGNGKESVITEPYTMEAKKNNPVDKYAIIVVGDNMKGYGSTVDNAMQNNYFWLNGTYVYKYLKEMGFNHIYFFYDDGKPDFSEKINGETIRLLKKKFKGRSEVHEATYENLERMVYKLSREIDENDVFVLMISSHGSKEDITMQWPDSDWDFPMEYSELEAMLKKIKAGFSLLYIDACESGAYIKKLHLDDYVIISGTEGTKAGFATRDFSNARFFFRNLLDPESDTNVDGKITVEEAFKKGKKDAQAYLARVKNYLLTKFKWDDNETAEEALESISFTPTMIIGKKASANFYFLDSWYFDKK